MADVLDWQHVLTGMVRLVAVSRPDGPIKHTSGRRKRIQSEIAAKLSRYAIASPSILIPTNASEIQGAVLNYFQGLLPLEAVLCFGGLSHRFVLTGVFYRMGNLSWLMMNRGTGRIYLSSHWPADCCHLFERYRRDAESNGRPERRNDRQSFNAICRVYSSFEDYYDDRGYRLSLLPKAILRVDSSETCLAQAHCFLLSDPLRLFRKPDRFPQITYADAEASAGWRVFGKTTPLVGCEGATANRHCPCDEYKPAGTFTVDTLIQYVVNACPSIYDKHNFNNVFDGIRHDCLVRNRLFLISFTRVDVSSQVLANQTNVAGLQTSHFPGEEAPMPVDLAEMTSTQPRHSDWVVSVEPHLLHSNARRR